jgi:hypothetical protein
MMLIPTIRLLMHPHLFVNPKPDHEHPLAVFTISVSIGYFIYDILDMFVNNVYIQDTGIWVHHVLVHYPCTLTIKVIICFGSSIQQHKYSSYLTTNLLVEISNVFLHIRKLVLLSDIDPQMKDSFLSVNSKFLYLSFISTRMFMNAYVLGRVIVDYKYFAIVNPVHWYIALFGMITLNILNYMLFFQLRNADAKIRNGDAKKSD